MTEQEARDWIASHCDVPRETWARLDQFVDLLRQEAGLQNLIAASTLPHIWSRHIVDCAQLALLQPGRPASWLDLGSGAGFPGLVIAMLTGHAVTLVESRRKRIDFLERMIARLDLGHRVRVAGMRLESLETARFDTISARAFAPLDRLLPLAHRFAGPKTLWLLPKGKNAHTELDAIRGSWQGNFRIMSSVTDPDAGVLIADHVVSRVKR